MDWRQRKSIRGELVAADPHCQYCRKPLTLTSSTVDHATPLARGGPDERDNLRLACWPCNRRKGTRTIDEFRAAPWSSHWTPRQRQPFDYAGRNWLLESANELHRLLTMHGDVLRIARLTALAHSTLDAGTFERWVAAEFGWRPRTIERFCRIAVVFKDVHSATGSQWRALYKLAVPSIAPAAVDEAVQLLNTGRLISLRRARGIILRHNTHRKAATGTNRQHSSSTNERDQHATLKRRWLQLWRDRKSDDTQGRSRRRKNHSRSA